MLKITKFEEVKPRKIDVAKMFIKAWMKGLKRVQEGK
jgi:hypothetical protein